MPVDIVDVDAFTDPITAPAGADVRNAASFLDPLQKLANRTRNLHNRTEVLEDYCTFEGVQLPAVEGNTRYLLSYALRPATSTQWTYTDQYARTEANSPLAYWDLTTLLPRDSVLQRVLVLVKPAVDRMTESSRIRVLVENVGFGAVIGFPSAGIAIAGTAYDDGNDVLQWIVVDFSGAPLTVGASAGWQVEIKGGVDGGTNKDFVYACRVEFGCDTIRND